MSHVYRNRADDTRTPDELHYCQACDGYYGVPHTNSHCQARMTARWRPEACACAFCRIAKGKPIQGSHGYFLPGDNR